MKNHKFRLIPIALASIACIFTTMPVVAQQAQPTEPKAKPDASENVTVLNKFIVTATGDVGKVTPLTASFDVSLLGTSDVREVMQPGTAGLLNSVPGFYGESSGGEVNQNLTVNGLRPSFMGYISLQDDGLPVIYNGFLSEFYVRPDTSVERVEVVRNGPSGVFSPEAAAAIVNFIPRAPTTEQGDVTIAFDGTSNKRLDFFYGGPIAGTNWFGSVGGYYENGPGSRSFGYNVTNGGQVRFSLWRNFVGGSLSLSYKLINLNTAFYTSVPAAEFADGTLHALPGFDPRKDTLYSPQLRYGTVIPPAGLGEAKPQNQEGEYARTHMFTVKFDKDLGGGWKISNGLRFMNAHYDAHDDRSEGNSSLQLATNVLASSLSKLTTYASGLPGAPQVTSVALVRASDGAVISSPSTLNGNGLLLQTQNFNYTGNFNNIINDLRATWSTDANTLSLGMMYLYVPLTNEGERGNVMLTDVRNHSQPYDIVGLNAQGQVVDHLTDNGVLTYGGVYYGNGSVITTSTNYYIDDQYQITKQLRIDGGVRFEEVSFATTAENLASNAPLPIAAAHPTVVAAQTAATWGNGTYAYGSSSTNDLAWSLGVNYKFSDNFSVFARNTKGFDSNVQDFAVFGGQNSTPNSRSALTTLRFNQVGLRFENAKFAFSGTAFWCQNNNVGLSGTLANSTPTTVFIDYVSKGIDFESVWRPVHSFQLEVGGVVQRVELSGIPSYLSTAGVKNGDHVDRIPDLQIRVKPSYRFDRGNVYLLATSYSQRYGDLANTQKLGAYVNYGAGFAYNFTNAFSLQIIGDNLANTLAYTEGNPRGGSNLNTSGQTNVLARPILGRNVRISCNLRF